MRKKHYSRLRAVSAVLASKDQANFAAVRSIAIGSANPQSLNPRSADIVLTGMDETPFVVRERLRHHEARPVQALTERPLTDAEWLGICDRQDGKCARCSKALPLTIDHVIPVRLGGEHTLRNIQALCRACNSSKGQKSTDYRVAA